GEIPAESRRYSTADLLATESHALHTAIDRQDEGLAAVPSHTVEAVLADGALSVDQGVAVRRLLTSGAGVEVVVGPAGSGKTAALRAAHAAWKASGVEVCGVAVAAIAARTLQAGTGIQSQSLARLARAIRGDGPGEGLPPAGGVLVVDEAGMVGTRDLAWLTEATRVARVKLVAIGDPAQLPEIDAGGLFDAWTRALPHARLSGNLRQREDWERDALAVLRDGDVQVALNAYDGAGRLHLHDDAPAARAALITDYLNARQNGGEVVMLTSRRSDAQVLNTMARQALGDAGGLDGPSLTVTVSGRPVEWRNGDEALITRNDYRHGLINGTRGRVTHVGADGVTVATDTGPLQVPRQVLDAGVLAYGYALTCHKAQGITVDIALLYASSPLTRESGYVGMSRGRSANHLYGSLDALLPEVDAELDHPSDDSVAASERTELMRAALVARLEVRGRQRLALADADPAARERVERWMAAGRDTARRVGRSR
ncbi:MAG TPA: AAA family ATPase, partial [Mycobacteriales bacterium]|nr:AAA family ATPase [Mycobacteriales bacterium]